jgi:cytochrome c peroxidase
MKIARRFNAIMLSIILAAIPAVSWALDLHTWDEKEKATLKSLWIGALPPVPEDPSNKYGADPEAAAFGKKLFFDTRLSGNLKVSCATCHPENMNFADNLPLAHGIGTTNRRTMPLVGVGYNTWFFWDGRKDSLWSQALGPIENSVEHGFTRTQCSSVIIEHYMADYEHIFGPLPEFTKRDLPPTAKPSLNDPSALKAWISMTPDKKNAVNRIYANMGKAIAAFMSTILPTPSRFDEYVEAVLQNDFAVMLKTITNDEAKGLRLFIGKAKCTNCHSGPLFTNGEFHNTGVPHPDNLPGDNGRSDAITKVLADEFNCLSSFSDAKRSQCFELRFIDTETYKYVGAFKTPTLRNVAERPPYMHAGQISTLRKVLEFYRDLKPEQRSADLEHGDLNDLELEQLEAFLGTLSAPLSYAK